MNHQTNQHFHFIINVCSVQSRRDLIRYLALNASRIQREHLCKSQAVLASFQCLLEWSKQSITGYWKDHEHFLFSHDQLRRMPRRQSLWLMASKEKLDCHLIFWPAAWSEMSLLLIKSNRATFLPLVFTSSTVGNRQQSCL